MKLANFFETEWQGDERRAAERSPVRDALSVMTDHMYSIQRALNANDIETAQRLVAGAIKAYTPKGN